MSMTVFCVLQVVLMQKYHCLKRNKVRRTTQYTFIKQNALLINVCHGEAVAIKL